MNRTLIILLSLLICVPVHSQTAGTAHCIPLRSDLNEEDLAFKAGEHFRFTIHYTWGIINSDVGVADVDLDTVRVNGQKAFHCKVYGKTWRWYDAMFKVREDFQSWFTADGLRPLKFIRDTKEGKYVCTNTYNYMWDAPEPYIDADLYSSHSDQRTMTIPLDDCTFDLPLLFFLARNMDLDNITAGVKYPMTFAIDDDVYNVHFILLGRETLKLKGIGKIHTLKFAAKLVAGTVFTGEEDMTIWVSDDDNRIPLQFVAPILVGVASGTLDSYSNLKYPFSSLIKK